MKKSAIILVSLASLMFGGCYGSYSLTKKVYKFTGETGAEPIPTIVNWIGNIVLGPILFVDFAILNTIEYWSGSNPLAMEEGQEESQIVRSEDGQQYRIIATQNKFEIFQIHPNQSEELVVEAAYSQISQQWIMTSKSGAQIATRLDDQGQVEIYPIAEAL